MEKEKKDKKKHRHKWVLDWCDCPFCGGGSYYFCDIEGCDEMRDENKKKF